MKNEGWIILFVDASGNDTRYMNGAMWETRKGANEEIKRLKIDNIKFNKGRQFFRAKKVKFTKI